MLDTFSPPEHDQTAHCESASRTEPDNIATPINGYRMISVNIYDEDLSDLVYDAMKANGIDADDPSLEGDFDRICSALRPPIDRALSAITTAIGPTIAEKSLLISALAMAGEAIVADAPELAALDSNQLKSVMGELASALTLRNPPRNPAGWLRKIAASVRDGSLEPRRQRTRLTNKEEHGTEQLRFMNRHGSLMDPEEIIHVLQVMAESSIAAQFHPVATTAMRFFFRCACVQTS